MPKVGMRNIKTAIAVFLCFIILSSLKMSSPFYACIAAVITMQNAVELSFKTGLDRMAGTLIGAGFGILFSTISPNNILLTTIGIIAVIYMTNLLKRKSSTSIACIVFLAIMTNLTDTTPIIYSAMRVFETFVGIIIAVGVNSFISPPKPSEEKNADVFQQQEPEKEI